MKKLAIALAAIILIAFGAFLYFNQTGTSSPAKGVTYENADYGIVFTYPEGYTLAEHDAAGSALRGHHVITLVRDEDVTPPENGEGATAVTIDIYQNDLDRETLTGWVTGSSESNLKLGPGLYATTSVGATDAVTYRWSGLYEGETTAFIHEDSILAVSVTTLSPQDPIIGAYVTVLRSMRLF